MKEERPWGWYEVIDQGDRYKVKNIEVKPGHRLSLQKHHHRTEHWIVVSGTAEVQLNDARQLIGENQSTYIPLGCKHRLSNPGKIPLKIIEVPNKIGAMTLFPNFIPHQTTTYEGGDVRISIAGDIAESSSVSGRENRIYRDIGIL